MMRLLILLVFLFSCTSTTVIEKKTKTTSYVPNIKVKITKDKGDYRGNIVNQVNILNLEEYLYSVVSSEVPSSFEMEALKAQAVAARTYAYYHILNSKKDFHVYDSVLSQNYEGKRKENLKAIQAVDETRGQIMTYKGETIESLYHSSSGYYTTSAKDYFNYDVDYLQSVVDFTEDKKWTKEKSLKEVKRLLPFEITIDNLISNKRKVREKLGLRSPNFDVKIKNNKVYFYGVGYGHGVGMSQYGANYLAKKSYTYLEILKHYYQNVEIKKIY